MAKRRGEPLMVLGLIIGGWLAMRSTFIGYEIATIILAAKPASVLTKHIVSGRGRRQPTPPMALPDHFGIAHHHSAAAFRLESVSRQWASRARMGRTGVSQNSPVKQSPAVDVQEGEESAISALYASQNIVRQVVNRSSRWSGDGWVLWRNGPDAASLAEGAGAYGRSQYGVIMRFAAAPNTTFNPQIYMRATGALGGGREQQVALGIMAKPVGVLPISVMAEGRVHQTPDHTTIDPVVRVVGGFASRLRETDLEFAGYGQAGWVGGSGATPFFDLQANVDRKIGPQSSAVAVYAGGGLWAGGQRGVARVDLGPRLSIRGNVGRAPVRLAFDWRFRIRGRAQPGSGPALTLSTGF
jgi:hypothetical protein